VRGTEGTSLAREEAKSCLHLNSKPINHHPWPMLLIKDTIETVLGKMWAHEWLHSSTGTRTKEFFPSPTDANCLKNSYIHHELTEVLTGHCRLNHHLHKIKKFSSPMSECGQDTETVDYFLFHCIRFTDQRALLIDACLRNKKPFPPSLDVISKRKSIWNAFKVFIRTSERLKIRSTAHGQCTPPLPRSKANVQSKPTGQFL
jgi:hypothetical protein